VSDHPPHWDVELQRLESHAQHVASHKATAVIGVAVDDDRKRDYFVPRLQQILNDHAWAQSLTFRVVPVMGGTPVDLVHARD
jgi:hypothetical protein